jgi:VIT1/CCC1 family predicted Fe2+/Mn2+ transporter
MYRMDIAEGALVLSGLLLILFGAIYKITGVNLLDPMVRTASASFIAANTCFLLSVVVYLFNKGE